MYTLYWGENLSLKFRDLKLSALISLKNKLESAHLTGQGICSENYLIEDINFIDLLDYVETHPLCYFRHKNLSTEYLALGSVLKISANDLDQILEESKQNESLHIFGSWRFDPERELGEEWSFLGDSFFFLPRVLFKREKQQFKLVINYTTEELKSNESRMKVLLEVESLLTFKRRHETPNFFDLKDTEQYFSPSKEVWQEMIDTCVNAFKASTFEKVVMCRKNILSLRESGKGRTILQKLLSDGPDSYIFYLEPSETHAFISLSPEKLFELRGQEISTDAIAGTRSRGITPKEDLHLQNELLNSSKDLLEQRIVTDVIQEKLDKICQEIQVIERESILKLKYVQHIVTSFKGILRPNVSLTQIIKELHPTPAVGGRPWKKAHEFIQNLEPFDRGMYAAPMGVIGPKSSELIVGIRSALIEHKNIHIFGGAGIVPGSLAHEEWTETQNKMKNFLLSL
jgi:menaquinone-specific isochorismate synthase